MHENTNASLEKNKLIVARSNRYTFLPFKSEAKYGVHYFILHWAGQKEINDEFFIRHKQPWLHPSRLGITILFCCFSFCSSIIDNEKTIDLFLNHKPIHIWAHIFEKFALLIFFSGRKKYCHKVFLVTFFSHSYR